MRAAELGTHRSQPWRCTPPPQGLEDLLAGPGTWTSKTPSSTAAPRPGPPERALPKAAWEPLGGAGAPGPSRGRPAPQSSGPRSAADYCVSFPPDRFIYSPGRQDAEPQAVTRTPEGAHTHTGSGLGSPAHSDGRAPQVSAHCTPRRGEGTKMRSLPARRPLLPRAARLQEAEGGAPGLDGGPRGAPL